MTPRYLSRTIAAKPPTKRPPGRRPTTVAPDLTRPSFGPRLKVLREQRAHTQLDLATKIGVSVATISRWERGLFEPQIQEIIGISYALDITIDELLNSQVIVSDPMPDALMHFLRTTGGRMALEAGLLPTLRHLRTAKPPTVELYQAITVALLGAGAGED